MDRQKSHLHTGIAIAVIVALSALAIQLFMQFERNLLNLSSGNSSTYGLTFSTLTNTPYTEFNQIIHEDFTEAPLNTVPKGFGELNHWYHLNLYNHANEVAQLRLLIDNPLIDAITIYHPDPRFDDIQVTKLGDHQDGISLEQRILPNYAFDMAPGQTKNLWLHIENNGTPIIALSLLDESDFAEHERLVHILWGAFIGLTIVLSIYNAVLYIGLRDSAYLHYIAYLISILVLMGVVHGFGYYLFPIEVQKFLSHKIISVQTLVALCALNFGKNFLGITKVQKAAHRIVTLNFYCILFLFALSLAVEESFAAPAFAIVQGLSYITVIVIIRYRFFERIHWTRYYLLSWIPFFIGAAISILMFSGVIEYNLLLRHIFLMSIIFEMALISMALANRMGESERLRLHQASHDIKSQLPNEYFIKEKLSRLAYTPNQKRLSLIAIRVSNYDQVTPYLSDENERDLLKTMVEIFIEGLTAFGEVQALDNDRIIKTSFINNNTFTFLLRLNDATTLIEVLSKLSDQDNFNPLQDQIPFRIQCLFAGRELKQTDASATELLNSINQCINLASTTQEPFTIYDTRFDIDGARAIQLAQDLENAIERNELELYHQPQLQLGSSQDCHSEVLARWQHSSFGFISPSEFILIAEQTGLIKKLTTWVIAEAFRHFKSLEQTCNGYTHIAINVSAIDLSRRDFALDVIQAGNRFKITPKQITFEVTETSHLQDQFVFKTNVIHLKRAGFRLAIDDFGTGYSSLTYISSLPFDELKIDRSFVKDMLMSERQLQIVGTTIQMARSLGLSVTAEGIEDEPTLNQLKQLLCSKIQGFHYAKPMPFEDYQNWLVSEIEAFNSKS